MVVMRRIRFVQTVVTEEELEKLKRRSGEDSERGTEKSN